MQCLSNGAFPAAAMQLIEAVRAYRRTIENQPQGREEQYWDYRRTRRLDTGRILREFLDDPLARPSLNRANWATNRPKLYITTYTTDTDALIVDVRPSLKIHRRRFLNYSFIEGDTGDFEKFDFSSYREGVHPIIQLAISSALSSTLGAGAASPYDEERMKFERHLCVLLIKAKLHQLSLYFDVHMISRVVEFSERHFVEFRYGPEVDRWKANSDGWLPAKLQTMATSADLSPQELYKFAELHLRPAARARRSSLLGEYLASSYSSSVSDEDVALLLKLRDLRFRSTLRLKEMETDASYFEIKDNDTYWWLSRFIKDSGLGDEEKAIEWLIVYQPQVLAIINAPTKYARHYFKRKGKGWRLAESLRTKLDAKFATSLGDRWNRGSSVSGLDYCAHHFGFDTFANFCSWASKHAPLTSVAAGRLEAETARREMDAKAATQAKRKATIARRRAERGEAP